MCFEWMEQWNTYLLGDGDYGASVNTSNKIIAVKRSIGFTIGFHNSGPSPG